jgi:hypothetical protein
MSRALRNSSRLISSISSSLLERRLGIILPGTFGAEHVIEALENLLDIRFNFKAADS